MAKRLLTSSFSIALLAGSAWCQIPSFTMSTIAGNGIEGYSGDGGTATSAELNYPRGIASDPAGNIYFCDYNNNRLRKISTSGIITTAAGTGTNGYNGDNVLGVNAALSQPYRVSLDAAGNVYIADAGNNRIRKLSPAGIITTVAGNGVENFAGDGGPATSAAMDFPEDAVVDASGNIYIADTYNYVIRKVTPSGLISTIGGKGGISGYSGDGGPATQALIGFPVSLTVDPSGNVYVSDQINNVIRKISTSGIISTVAGNGNLAFSGDGGPATSAALNTPAGVALDPAGNLYIADNGNYRVRVLLTNGNIVTVAGNGNVGSSGDGGPATSAEMNLPKSISVGTFGDVFIADMLNNKVRQLTPTSTAVGFMANAFGNTKVLAPNTWAIIKGTNLSPTGDSRTWQASDFVNGQMPTSLDGVSVTMNGLNAYVYYISPTQVNILTPPGLTAGLVQVEVTNNGTKAPIALIQAMPYSLSLFEFGAGPYAAAVHLSGALIGPSTLYPGQSTPAQPGETIVLYGNGFGSTSSTITSGSSTQSGTLPTLPVFTIGGVQATVQFAGLISPGLYQFNVVVPNAAPAGDNALVVTYNGLATQPGVLLTVQ